MNSCVGLWDITILILGIITMGVGLDSHSNSDWKEANEHDDPCQQHGGGYTFGRKDKWCPPFELEQYFVSVIIICFILSFVSLFIPPNVKSYNWMIKLRVVYHAVAAVLLLIAGGVYIASAIQVVNMRLYGEKGELQLRTTEKVIAGGFAAFQGLIYGVAACFIGFGDRNGHEQIK